VTAALVTMAPVESVIVPRNVLSDTCAIAGVPSASSHKESIKRQEKVRNKTCGKD